jgi:cellulose synthase/poly-beta-1,6-N-acetylglucosamine synthase-like glycosyltransferase
MNAESEIESIPGRTQERGQPGAASVTPAAGAPRVSVLLPVRNGERFVADSVASILGQELVELELVVVDNGSTDSTPSILTSIADPRLRVIPEPRPGLVQNEIYRPSGSDVLSPPAVQAVRPPVVGA